MFNNVEYNPVRSLNVIPRTLIGVGVGACAALALRVSIPGGMLFGLCHKVGTYAYLMIFKHSSFDLGPALGIALIVGVRSICAIIGASPFIALPHLALMAITFVAVDVLSYSLYNDFWMF